MNKKGFTLLEILLVVAAIAILAGIVIIAINPGKQLATVRNTSRRSDVNTILNAIYQYAIDNNGIYPVNLDTNLKMLGTAGSGCNISCSGFSASSSTPTITTNPVSITDNSQSTFLGTNSNTTYNTGTSLLNLSASQISGTYISDVKDAGSSATWSTLAWLPNRPIGKALPNNAATETGYPTGNANMSGNVLLMHLDEASGATTFADSSGSSNGGTCSGTTCPVMGAAGKFSTAATFDGVNDYIISKSIPVNGGNLTASAWVKWGGTTVNTIAVAITKDPTFTLGFGWSPHKPTIWINGGGGYLGATGVTNMDDGKWHYLAGVYNGASIILYVDGVQEGINNVGAVTTMNSAGMVVVGAINSSVFNQNWNGLIDEAALFTRALSSTEILDNYKRGVLSLKYQVKSCITVNCSDNNTFVGPDNSPGTYFSESNNSTLSTPSFSLSSITNNRYFQYKALLDTTDATLTPELKSVIISGSASVSSGGTQQSSSSTSTASACLNLSSFLAPSYITSIPFDPKTGTDSQTYYAVQKTAGGRINVQACSAENGETISVTK